MADNRKVRVLMLSHHEKDPNAGAASVDLQLAQCLKARGYDVDVCFYDDILPGSIKGTTRQLLFPWFSALYFLRNWRKKFEIIESTAGDAYVIRFITGLAGLKRPLFSIRTHGLEHRHAEVDLERRKASHQKLSWVRFLYHFKYRLWEVKTDIMKGNAVFFLNQQDATYAKERFCIPDSKIHVIPNAISNCFHGMPRKELTQTDLLKLLFLGSWIPRKGIDTLVEIITRVFKENQHFQLTCAGTQQSEEIVKSCFPVDARKRIQVIPKYLNHELPEILERHGILIAPFRAEGFGLVVLEAMAAGMIVLATPVGHAPSAIQNGENGFLLGIEDTEGFVRTILRFSNGQNDATRISANAASSVNGYTWENRTDDRIKVWQKVLLNGRTD